MKKQSVVFLVLLWTVFLLTIMHLYNSGSRGAKIPSKLTIVEDVNVFMFKEDRTDIDITRLEKGKRVFFETDGDYVLISTNGRFVDLDQSYVYRLQDENRVELSLQDKVVFFQEWSSRKIDLDIDISSAEKNGDSFYFSEYVDFTGDYEGRVVITKDDQRICKEYTNVDSILRENREKKLGMC